MIAVRLPEHFAISRQILQAVAHQDTQPSLRFHVLESGCEISSLPGELLLTSPLSRKDAEFLDLPPTGGGWVVVSDSPGFCEALEQVRLGASDYVSSIIDLKALEGRLTGKDENGTVQSLEAEHIRNILAFFDEEGERGGVDWGERLTRLAEILDVDQLGIVRTRDEYWCSQSELPDDDSCEELLVSSGFVVDGYRCKMVLGRHRMRAEPIESLGLSAMVCVRLIGQQLAREGLLARITRAKREWEQTVDAISDPIVMLDHNRSIVRANRAFAQTVGSSVKDVVGRSVDELFDLSNVQACLDQRSTEVDGDSGPTLLHASARYLEMHTAPISTAWGTSLLYLRDITEARRLTSLLVQKERFSALGELADGVFHDLNNLASTLGPELACVRMAFAPIRATIEAQVDNGTMESTARGDMDAIAESLGAATLATRRLEQVLSVLRQYSCLIQETDVDGANARLIDVSHLLRALPVLFNTRARRQQVVFNLEFGPVLPIDGNAGELLRIFENLIKNALDAMPGGGTIGIMTSGDENQVTVEIRDTGHGIPEDQLDRIFDRGHTSRQRDGGTGLGLYIAREIAESHAGKIRVASQMGLGTVFTVEFPTAR